MMLRENLRPILDRTAELPYVLDVGGMAAPLNTATHILDALGFRAIGAPLDPTIPPRFSEATCIQRDICKKPWPFRDDFFDYSFCSHTLEDIRDPVGVCEELMRVSREGYIDVPSRLRESFHQKKGYLWRRIIGRPLRIGWGHHRWFCEREEGGLVFTAKTATSGHSREFFITYEEIGRDLSPEEGNIGFFWKQRFPVREQLLIEVGETEADCIRFKLESLALIRSKTGIVSEPRI